MLVAGLSELFIIFALIFGLIRFPQSAANGAFVLFILCAITVAGAAFLGLLKFLQIVHFEAAYSAFKFVAGLFATTGIVMALIWHELSTRQMGKLGGIMLAFAAAALALNLFISIPLLGSVGIILAASFAVYLLEQARGLAFAALLSLLSTLVWGAIIIDDNWRIGAFHLSVGLFFALLTLASQRQLDWRSQTASA